LSLEPLAEPTPAELARAGLGMLVVGLPLALIGLRWLARWPVEPREDWSREGWSGGPLDLVLAPVLFVFGQLVAALGLGALFPGAESVEEIPVLVKLAAVPVSMLPLLLLIAARARQARNWRPVGLGLGADGTHVLRALGLWALAVPTILSLMLVSSWLYGQLGLTWEEQAWGPALRGISGASAVAAVLLAVVIVPFCEELLFRGWLQQGLATYFGPRRAVPIVAALFALGHDAGVLLPIFALALVLGVIRERTQRLWPSVVVHMVHNGVQVALLVARIN
jgi:CAAX protease family protein